MDTKGVITLIFVILILAVGLAVAISKYIQQKKKYQRKRNTRAFERKRMNADDRAGS